MNRPLESDSTQMVELQIKIVKESYARCCVDHNEFFDSFYENLSRAASEIGPMFASTNMEKQNSLIREGIKQLIDYADGSDQAAASIKKLAESHNRDHLNIRPELYPVWVESLLQSVREHDREYDAEVESAWRAVLSEGIELMASSF